MSSTIEICYSPDTVHVFSFLTYTVTRAEHAIQALCEVDKGLKTEMVLLGYDADRMHELIFPMVYQGDTCRRHVSIIKDRLWIEQPYEAETVHGAKTRKNGHGC